MSLFNPEIDVKNKRTWILITILSIVFLSVVVAVSVYKITYAARVIPGISLNHVPIGGMNERELRSFLSLYEERLDKGFTLTFTDQYGKKRTVEIPLQIDNYDSPLADIPLYTFDKKNPLKTAFSYGHTRSLFNNIVQQWISTTQGININLDIEWNQEALERLISQKLEPFAAATKDAQLVIQKKGDDYSIQTKPEQAGWKFDMGIIIRDIENSFLQNSKKNIPITLQREEAKIRASETENAKQVVEKILGLTPITILIQTDPNSEGATWLLEESLLHQALEYRKYPDSNTVKLGLNREKMLEFLGKIALAVQKDPSEAKFKIENGKVLEFQPSNNGWKIPIENTYNLLNEAIVFGYKNNIIVALDPVTTNVSTDKSNTLGIREIIGIGYSDFGGSPANRIHNISVGAKTLNGILISPGEEFSLGNALGPIELETGYLPELVIKGNRTIPEVGGGLCQIGTTMFRAALASGLPITERQNHSFTVQYYYEDGLPGTDATIYPPKPDLRFVNDTSNSILIQTHIDGTQLRFEFWGTKDGRTAERSKPEISNRIPPAAPKIIETAELKVGEKRCTEKPHAGLTAIFDYRVVYPDGRKNEQIFKSVYRPWQEVCLVGVEKIEEPNTPQETTEKTISDIDSNSIDIKVQE
jgi:vancomycin resistance protein YoaR